MNSQTDKPIVGDQATAVIRTVAQVCGSIIWTVILSSPLAGLPFFDGLTEEQIVTYTVPVVTAIWVPAVGWLERNIHPAFGFLFGIPKAPTYQ